MRNIQKKLLGMFAGGVLLTGIGTGIALVEYSTLSYGGHKIIGEDNLDIFTQWREYQYILENFDIFVYPRKGSTRTMKEIMEALEVEDIKNIHLLQDAPYFDISSTELRKNLHI